MITSYLSNFTFNCHCANVRGCDSAHLALPTDGAMIAATRRWFQRNRNTLLIGAGVIGAGYVAGQYVIGKLQEARQRVGEERVAKEKYVTMFASLNPED